MNIQKINANTICPLLSTKDNLYPAKPFIPRFGITAAKPLQLQHDIVTFKAKGSKIQKVLSAEVRAARARKEARALRDMRQIAEAKARKELTKPTKKELAGNERTWGVTFNNAKKIRSKILKPQERVHAFLHVIFDDLVVSDLASKNLLLNIGDRAKSPVSIMEKSATRRWNSVQEVLDKMTDLNGGKLVMNYKTGKNEVENTLDRLIPLIKTKQIVLQEIELQRPEAIEHLSAKDQEFYDYGSKEFLDRLEDAQEEIINGLEENVDKIKLIDRPVPKYTKGNYCALHLLLKFPEEGERPFEVQIMGPRVATGKYIDDDRFKFFDGKQLEKKYNKLVKLWEPLKADANKDAKERFIQYCKDANFELRERELREYASQRLINRNGKLFISIQDYSLPPKYDLDNCYAIKKECDRLAAIAAKNLEEARNVKAAKQEEPKKHRPLLSPKAFAKLMELYSSNKNNKNRNKIR